MKFNLTLEVNEEAMRRARANAFMEPPSTPDGEVLAKQVRFALEQRGINGAVVVTEPPLLVEGRDVYMVISAGAEQVESIAEWVASEVQSLAFKSQTAPFGSNGERAMVGLVFEQLDGTATPAHGGDKIGADF